MIRWLQGQDKPQAEWLNTNPSDQTLIEPAHHLALQKAPATWTARQRQQSRE